MNNIYHLRITIPLKEKNCDLNANRKFASEIWYAFKVRFLPEKYLVYYEISGKGVPHVHIRLKYGVHPSKQQISAFFALKGLSGLYHHEVERDKLRNELYIMKDGDRVDTNYSAEEIKALEAEIERINADKQLASRHKLFNLISPKMDHFEDKTIADLYDFVLKEIDFCHIEHWDKLPPPRDLSYRYAKYIIFKKFGREKLFSHNF